MFRRKTRNSTAYTGVGQAAPSAQQPNNSAMAAALTIGQNLKQSQPEIYKKPPTPVVRKQQHQHPAKPHTSLLKRSSSIQHSIAATSTPRDSRTGSNISKRQSLDQVVGSHEYHVDDSFNDSVLEEMGNEADAHYSNEARLRDLKLHHQPQPTQPKMVKKYIPTPNGITVVEVPEDTMKRDIARSNSMRSGLSLSRSGSMQRIPRTQSLTNAAKQKRHSTQRMSSLVNTYRIEETNEAEGESSTTKNSSELESLQKKIEHEKQLARDLEKKRLEYEQLRQLRLQNEINLRELQDLAEKDRSPKFEGAHRGEGSLAISTPEHVAVQSKRDVVSPISTPRKAEDFSEPAKSHEVSDSEEDDVPIAPVPFVVDEMDSKKMSEASTSNGHITSKDGQVSPQPHEVTEPSASISTSPHELLMSTYAETFVPINELERPTKLDSPDNFGIEEIPPEKFDSPTLASQLRPTFDPRYNENSEDDAKSVTPDVSHITSEHGQGKENTEVASPKFDPVPEVIGVQESESPKFDTTHDDSLIPPSNFAGSIRSVSSTDSKSRPIKSAMKNSKPYTSNGNSIESPAQQAYLSLTTAENTRLNSKLSSSQLNEIRQDMRTQSFKPPSSPQQKRMSQSLRKQPSSYSQGGGLAGRSLRPSSGVDFPQARHNGGMNNRNSKVSPQPIPVHPTSKPNYQSPSKLKAAELYAKANSRPISEFHPIQRKSSFSRVHDASENGGREQPQRMSHRTTLHQPRPMSPKLNPTTQPPVNQVSPLEGKFQSSKSKVLDSDDEQNVPPRANAGFKSRFADSDEDLPNTGMSNNSRNEMPTFTLRHKEQETKGDRNGSKEKKPKKKFLKKLFGRN